MNQLLTELENLDMDINGSLERFVNNETLYIRFLKKFLNDPNMEKLKLYMEEGDMDNAFQCAHTLKGVTGNLGLTALYVPLCQLVKQFRMNDTDNLDVLFQDIYDCYQKTCKILRQYQ